MDGVKEETVEEIVKNDDAEGTGAVDDVKTEGEPVKPVEDPEHTDEDPKGFVKRINKIVFEREEQKRRADAAEAELAKLKAGEPKPETKPDAVVDGPPKRPVASEFEDYDKYLDAMAEYAEQIADYKAKEERKRWDEDRKRDDEDRKRKEALKPIEAKLNRGREKYADFEEVVMKNEPIYSEVTRQLTLESEHTDEIAYYLAKNPEFADRIAGMGALEASREFIKLEDKIKSGELNKTKKASQVDQPITPVGTGQRAIITDDIDPDLPIDEYIRRMDEKALSGRT